MYGRQVQRLQLITRVTTDSISDIKSRGGDCFLESLVCLGRLINLVITISARVPYCFCPGFSGCHTRHEKWYKTLVLDK